MSKRELTRDEKDLVYWYSEVINANQQNARMLEGKYLSDRQAEKRYLDVADPDDREKFLAAKKLAK